jgi:hypothetical protein
MIRKSGNRFSEKIMLKQKDKIMIRLNLIGSWPRMNWTRRAAAISPRSSREFCRRETIWNSPRRMGGAQRYPSHRRGSSSWLAEGARQDDGFRKCSTHPTDCWLYTPTPPRSRRVIRASFASHEAHLKVQRAQGMPGARCTRSLACKNRKHTSVVTTGSPASPGIPRAMVLRLIT